MLLLLLLLRVAAVVATRVHPQKQSVENRASNDEKTGQGLLEGRGGTVRIVGV